MDALMPGAEPMELVGPHYPKGEQGRKPVGLGIMVRVYFVSTGLFCLTRQPKMRSTLRPRFAGIDLGRASAPVETTILNFRHLLEAHD
jgi:IS5 family transposase